ncbi:hypothetical protein [Massilia glaciei]|uniref:DUF3757 domain-containing protein n=1 Tax=Massilia glaciei TaxID=1524097 RepID=A0A2U2HM96_9BURK|nr:hypothetical protein [Massilia glaciei]PWF48599.1 hypothetical protein C7C56_010865 [Massilia glaciei]
MHNLKNTLFLALSMTAASVLAAPSYVQCKAKPGVDIDLGAIGIYKIDQNVVQHWNPGKGWRENECISVLAFERRECSISPDEYVWRTITNLGRAQGVQEQIINRRTGQMTASYSILGKTSYLQCEPVPEPVLGAPRM